MIFLAVHFLKSCLFFVLATKDRVFSFVKTCEERITFKSMLWYVYISCLSAYRAILVFDSQYCCVFGGKDVYCLSYMQHAQFLPTFGSVRC